jgi:hypothetical protein
MAAAYKDVDVVGVNVTQAIAQWQPVTAAGALAAAAANSLGFAMQATASGGRCPVLALGRSVAIAGGAIAQGAAVEIGAAGTVVTKAAGVTVGRALTAAAANGDQIEVLVIPN